MQWDESVLPYFTAVFGHEGLARLSRVLCRPPLRNSFRVNLNRASREEVVKALAGQDENEFSEKSAWSNHAELPDVLIHQGTGPHAVDYEDTQGKEVIISRRAAEAVLRGADVFVPGVMACSLDMHEGDLVAVSIAMELPGSAGYITRGSIIDAALPAASSLYVGKGIAQLSRQYMFKAQSGIGVKMTARVYDLQPCHGLLPGQGMLQNLPSAVVAHVLAPPPGSRVLDMCASPGGKSTHLAQLMNDQGQVIALDRTHAKAQQIRNLAAELGLSCIQAFKLDATTALQQQTTPEAAVANVENTVSDAAQDATTALQRQDTPQAAVARVDDVVSDESQDATGALQQQDTAAQAAVAHLDSTTLDVPQSQINQKSKLRQERKAKV